MKDGISEDSMGIMEKYMETTIGAYIGFRVEGLGLNPADFLGSTLNREPGTKSPQPDLNPKNLKS